MTIVNDIVRSEAPFFLFRRPGEAKAWLGVCREAPRRVALDALDGRSGLLVAPFDPAMKPWLMEAEMRPVAIEEIALEEIALEETALEPVAAEAMGGDDASARTGYLAQCQAFVDAIRAGEAEKAILARTLPSPCLRQRSAATAFRKLAEAHPGAFVSLIRLPDEGMWLGATPELLISLDPQGRFATMSLAGTKPATSRFDSPESWPAKERREQAIVTEYIADTLTASGIPFEQAPTDVCRAGAVLHLRTRFGGRIARTELPRLVASLHPTPAVCGRPLAAALRLIHKCERIERRLYAGYLGPLMPDGSLSLYVNLRCARLAAEGAQLYAGGGITADSDPQREWEETCLKAQTLLRPITS
jgi:isochorismate synthase